ncbi:MAG TPA: SLC13 family permease [Verrucomicrobia bacterium]|nr:SLC13 family permease [Verrucomicrobiales bacterium]HIL54517.1 SLC13 family permease [Verrucomicrobiota bacterium]
MDFNQIFVCIILVLVFIAFVKEWFSPDLVAMGALVLLVGAGILPEEKALAVFSNPAPIIVSCMFVLSAALERTGTIEALGEWFGKLAGTREMRILVMLMLIVAPLSAFVNNTPVVVVFMPILLALARKHDLVASRFLIPLSYAAIVGGTCTIIGTSTNLVASGIAKERGLEEFGMFEVSKLGVIFVAVTFFYMLFIGRKLLPDRVTLSTLFESDEGKEFLTVAIISKGSELIGKNIKDSRLGKIRNFRVIEVVRSGNKLTNSIGQIVFEEGDQLLVKTRVEGVIDAGETTGIEIGVEAELGLQRLHTDSAILIEGVIGPGSSLVGRSLKDLNFRERFGVIILAVHRRGVNLRDSFENVKLAFGDTILVEGGVDRINNLSQERDFINLSQPKGRSIRRSKVPFAVGALLLFMVLASFKVAPLIVLALGAALFTLFTRCIEPSEAYESIDWKVVFMIFGMLGLGSALQEVKVVESVAIKVTDWAAILNNIHVLVAVIYLITAVLTEIISNNAVAALLTPVAITIGIALDIDPRPLVVAVMFAASASFSTPIGYQTNTYVYGAGGYKFTDFSRVGIPLALILWALSTFLIPLMWNS